MVLVQGEIRTNTLDSPADLLHKTRGIPPIHRDMCFTPVCRYRSIVPVLGFLPFGARLSLSFPARGDHLLDIIGSIGR